MSARYVFVPDHSAGACHPAVRMWGRLEGIGRRRPGAVEVLTSQKGRRGGTSPVYRLQGAGEAGSPIIAKRASRRSVEAEQRVYEEILPSLPIASLRSYGVVDEPDTDFAWLFLEDAGGEWYAGTNPAHRALAADWLGTIHVGTARMPLADWLPPRGPERFLADLRASRDALTAVPAASALDGRCSRLRQRLVNQFVTLEAHWPDLEELLGRMPKCLVHADFFGKNIRVRDDGFGPRLYVFDWGAAGWGVPAEDFAGLDISIYWRAIRGSWPHLDLETLERLSAAGTIFRCLACIEPTAASAAQGWADWAVLDLERYEGPLAQAIGALGWS
jgi:hypothetical protein